MVLFLQEEHLVLWNAGPSTGRNGKLARIYSRIALPEECTDVLSVVPVLQDRMYTFRIVSIYVHTDARFNQ